MRRLGLIAAIPVVLALASAPGASAATEVGSTCLANAQVEKYSLVQLTPTPGNPLPLDTPAGVITRWRIITAPFEGGVPQALKVYRPTGTALQYEVVGEDQRTVLGGSLNSFEVRVPVKAGDRLGLYGSGKPIGTFLCGASGAVAGAVESSSPLGAKPTFVETKNVQVPVSALVEPDVDGDGFGDETQDKCPRSATLQTECPVALVDSVPVIKRGAVTLLVASTVNTSVTASGTVKLPGGKGRARSSAQAKLAAVTKPALAGKITRITLKFPGSLKSALAALPPRKSLTLKLTASVTDATGAVATDTSNLKLKRQ